jgi:hypothetical protein
LHGESRIFCVFLSSFSGAPYADRANYHASRVESEPHAQRFERALLPAPKQGQEPRPVRCSRPLYERLFFGGKVIGDKTVATRLDHLQITA